MFIKFTSDVLVGSGIGFIVGAFTPSIGRKIKGLFVKESQKVTVSVATGVSAAGATIKEDLQKIEAKL